MQCPALLLLLSTLFISTSFLNAQTSDEGVHAPDGGTMEIVSSSAVLIFRQSRMHPFPRRSRPSGPSIWKMAQALPIKIIES